ncbi:hypothetical protein BH10ACT3_BH10ACT3_04680 [soil metagenome]
MSAVGLLLVVAGALLVAAAAYTLGLVRGRAATATSAQASAPSDAREQGPPDNSGPDTSAVGVADVLNEHLFERLSEAVDHIEQGVIVCDEHGADMFRNRVARAFTEASDGLVLVEAAVGELLQEALAGRSVRREVDLFGPPAQSFVITAQPFSGDAGGGALAIVEDRSLQRRTETVRRDFVANISHELKTPIGALGLLAETIRDEPDSEVVERLAGRMITEADRAGSTVDDLLELSRIEFGDDTEFDETSVQSIVAEAAGRLAAAADHAGITLDVDLPASIRVIGDRRQLVSAVYNLLDNAVKYSLVDSKVSVTAVVDPVEDLVHLSVEDSCIGIPRRDLDRVFERFYRVDRARSRVTGGTGLGLAIVRHVASNHGGDVSVESTEGVGTTFTLTLSAEPSATPSGKPSGQPSAAPSSQPSDRTPIGEH